MLEMRITIILRRNRFLISKGRLPNHILDLSDGLNLWTPIRLLYPTTLVWTAVCTLFVSGFFFGNHDRLVEGMLIKL